MNNIIRKKFSEIDLHDPFFDSLKRDYPGFDDWFGRKKDEPATPFGEACSSFFRIYFPHRENEL